MMKSMWMIIFLLLPVAGLTYASWHVWHILPLANAWRWTVVAVGILMFLTIFLNFGGVINRMPMRLATVSYEVGNSAIFVLLYVVMTFLVLDFARLVHLLPRTALVNNGYVAAGIAGVLFAVFVYGNVHYYNKVRQPLSLHTEKQQDARPLRIVMMSDLHLGYHNDRDDLRHWVDLVNAEHPDLVLIAGDIIDMSLRPLIEEDMAAEFRRIEAPIYASLGNHEYFSGEPRAEQFYADAGITLLRDSVVNVGNSLCLVGRDDRTNLRRKSLEELMRRVDKQRYVILLDHQPYNLEQAEHVGIDFQLSGHTHHGQVFPINLVTDAIYECAFGEHHRGQTRYYVSSGMGIWGGKFRIGTRSEYVVATLTFGQKQ